MNSVCEDLIGKCTVLMSVYSKELPEYLSECLQSIYVEQLVKPAQIVLVLDGPLTETLEVVIEDWREKLGSVLKVVRLTHNWGLARALNEGLKYCDYELVVRMDTDDIARPDRLQKQLQYMEANKDVSVLGGNIVEFQEHHVEQMQELRPLPTNDIQIKAELGRRNVIRHPTVMFRKEHILSVGGYPNMYPEDYMLWLRLAIKGFKFHNLSDVLINMRVNDNFLNRRGMKFLIGEMQIYTFLYKMKYINLLELITYISVRSIIRLSPIFVKRLIYKYFR